ncbi:hypothetical protein B0G57_10847 [Trinickia symbiotica]|uniref:DUF1326 domain-containing protein n=1 Tax=Trinickia symbiotica TaxID=863227 RepID=A0A2N7X2U5_9BURK|nr:DUF1326 domain-containing protein [Trinickia symbiotica]PMS35882.1 DUF1326 domain-containing protein [Trinickia symbiotica]PPK44467.1 hypothetical protein B0G57_10847 [Trinickia symbiotica]
MAWHIVGTYYAPCSCKVGCPCVLGELEGDQVWCSGGQWVDIGSGDVDGVDVSGAKLAWVADWPKGFLGGEGVGRIYFDSSVSAEQRAALEPLFKGERGGVYEVVGQLVKEWLPTVDAPIDIQSSADETRITVGKIGVAIAKPLRGATGEITRLLHGAAAFRDDIGLANGKGSSWRDPDMRQWESLGHAEITEFDWSA